MNTRKARRTVFGIHEARTYYYDSQTVSDINLIYI